MVAGLYTIPRPAAFLPSLARGLLAEYADAPEALARVTVLLPSRRTIRTLRSAFLQAIGDDRKALLLPRLLPFGELDEGELSLSFPGTDGSQLPPVVDTLERQWQLAQILRQRDPHLAMPHALRQADELARLLDQFETFEIGADDLHALAVERHHAAHWDEILKFLATVTRVWPQYLRDTGRADPAQRRAAALRLQAARWRDHGSAGPVIVAGVSRTEPALLELVQTALALPQGAVVLPGFDRAMDADSWSRLDPLHPDHLLRDLLERLGTTRADVACWPAADCAEVPRDRWLREAMRPAADTEAWQLLQAAPIDTSALDQVSLVACASEQEEARAIALIIRHALETPAQTISLVTPDRTLARLVAAQLRRWTIQADDSGGLPLIRTPLGAFLRLCAVAAAPDATPHDLLALAKHPYARLGRAPGQLHADLQALEKAALHDGFLPPGLAAWTPLLVKAKIDDAERARLQTVLADFQIALQPLCVLLHADGQHPLDALLEAHLQVAEALAATDTEGGDLLWQNEEGECAARFFYGARTSLGGMLADARDYAALLPAWLAPLTVRIPFGQHPRVTIQNLVDARLGQADVTILGGLNESVWPPTAPVSPFLSRAQLGALGLPDPDARLGQAAHDFAAQFSSPCVYMTRAARAGGAPTVPARWLLRLEAVLTDRSAAQLWTAQGDIDWAALAGQLDQPDAIVPAAEPKPTPPVAARPRQLSVTQVEQWLRDPYGLYAKKILRLSAMAPLADTPGAAERGKVVHAALEDFVRATLQRPRRDGDRAILQRCVADALQPYDAQPAVQALLRSYLATVCDWFLDKDEVARASALPASVEGTGKAELATASGPFTLTARADRIDRDAAGALQLIDYKTGTPPTRKDIEVGRAAQLSLEAVLASKGGFPDGATVGSIAYWRAPARKKKKDESVAVEGAALDMVMQAAADALVRLVDAFADAAVPYLATPLPDRVPPYNDYAQLARTAEWAFAEDEAADG